VSWENLIKIKVKYERKNKQKSEQIAGSGFYGDKKPNQFPIQIHKNNKNFGFLLLLDKKILFRVCQKITLPAIKNKV
jgi:hypothetical protein